MHTWIQSALCTKRVAVYVAMLALVLTAHTSYAVDVATVRTWADGMGQDISNVVKNTLKIAELEDLFTSQYQEMVPNDAESRLNALTAQLSNVITKKEKALARLTAKTLELYKQRVSNAKRGTFPDSEKPETLGSLVNMTIFGGKVSMAVSSVKLPNYGADQSVQAIDTDIVFSAGLDGAFKQNYLESEADGDMGWQYVGTQSGVYRGYPGAEWVKEEDGGYSPFDPRIRPWYVGASSGPKNIVILMDTSSAAQPNNRLSLMKKAVTRVLDSTTPADYVNVLSVTSDVRMEACFSGTLARATPDNVRLLDKFTDSLSAGGALDMAAGFAKAFDILESVQQHKTGAECETVILVVSCGESTTDPSDVVMERNSNIGARVFMFTLGDDADKGQAHDLACQTGGIHYEVDDNDPLLITYMGAYYQFFAYGSEREDVVWSVPYFDDGGLGIVITVSQAIWDRSTNPTTFVGVAGVDVRLSKMFSSFGTSTSGRSFGFVINNEAETVVHPLLKALTSYDADPQYIDIINFEGTSFAPVRKQMINHKSGKMTIDVIRLVQRGNSDTEGLRAVETTTTYYYKPVGNTPFSAALAIDKADECIPKYKEQRTRSNVQTAKHVYHRIEIEGYPPADYGVTKTYDPVKGYPLLLNETMYKVAPKGMIDTAKYLSFGENREPLDFALTVHNDVTDFTKADDLGGMFTQRVYKQLYASSLITPYWRQSLASTTEDILFLYVGSQEGLIRQLPGTEFTLEYDPSQDPWFARAITFPDGIAVSTLYKLDDENTMAITISQMLNLTEQIVAAADWKMANFAEFLFGSTECLDALSGVECVVVDRAGYVVAHPRLTDTRSEFTVWMGEWDGSAADSLTELNKGEGSASDSALFTKTTLDNYLSGMKQDVYQANHTVLDNLPSRVFTSDISASHCYSGSIMATDVPGTNLMLLVFDAGHVTEEGDYCCLCCGEPGCVCQASCGTETQLTWKPKKAPLSYDCKAPAYERTVPVCPKFDLTEAQIEILRPQKCKAEPNVLVLVLAIVIGSLVVAVAALLIKHEYEVRKRKKRLAELENETEQREQDQEMDGVYYPKSSTAVGSYPDYRAPPPRQRKGAGPMVNHVVDEPMFNVKAQ